MQRKVKKNKQKTNILQVLLGFIIHLKYVKQFNEKKKEVENTHVSIEQSYKIECF